MGRLPNFVASLISQIFALLNLQTFLDCFILYCSAIRKIGMPFF
ncbi:hypothetical protein PRO82_002016 [Candidatus Protochlamydia amoebophila]|nr:hypothetical protein [Candidatus Protochlamydia amoebophila]